jgi:ABC-2 type transport system ATP-binding protein
MNNKNILSFKNISKKFGNLIALNKISFDVPENSIYGILGANGSGKSTLMRILAGLINSWDGEIKYKNKCITYNSNNIISKFGFLIESPTFYEFLSAQHNLEILSRISNVDSSQIDNVLNIVNLSNRSQDLVKTYSYGMKQRLGLAQALLHDPQVLVLDEPNNGLDPKGIKDMSKLIRKLQKNGKTIFISTHILNEVEEICTHFTVLNKGNNIPTQDLAIIASNHNFFTIEVDNTRDALIHLENKDFITIHENNSNKITFHSKDPINLNTISNILGKDIRIKQLYKESNLINYFDV